MNCHEAHSKLDEYDSRTLNPDEHHAVSEHLLGCRDCVTELEALRTVTRALDQFSAPAPPPGLARRTCVALRELAEAEPPRAAPALPWFRRFLLPAAAAAVVALVVGLAWLNIQLTSQESPGTPLPVAGTLTLIEPEPLTLWADFNGQVLSKVKNPNTRMLLSNAFGEIVVEAEKENVEHDGKPKL